MAENKEPKKSKYIKDPADSKPTSKYIRQEGEVKKSKYIKTEEDRKAESERRYKKNTSGGKYHKNAGTTNLQNRRHGSDDSNEASESRGKLPIEVNSLDEIEEIKGNQDAIFTNKKADKDAYKHYKEAEQAIDDNKRASQILRTSLIMLAMLIIAIAINALNFRFSFFPSFLSIEFSAVPEFIVAIAYGPVFGIAIALIKNVFHMITHQPSYVSELQNFILDSFFVFLGGWIYTRRMFNFKATQKTDKRWNKQRSKRIMFAGTVGTIATTVVSYFSTLYISYPLLIKNFADYGYSRKGIIFAYQQSLDKINEMLPSFLSGRVTAIDSLSQAIMLYNVPLTLIKFLLITIAVALLYPPMTDFLHYRVNTTNKKKHSKKHHSQRIT